MNDQDRAVELLRLDLQNLIAADKDAQDADSKGNEADRVTALKKRADLLQAVRKRLDDAATGVAEPPDPLADQAVIDRALQAPDPMAVLSAALSPLRPATAFANVSQPTPVLWRDDSTAHQASTDVDAVLSIGEVAILASAGGLGKSTFTLEVASAAVVAADTGQNYGAACGLRVISGPVVLVSYEDAPARIAHRLTWMPADKVDGIHLWPDPTPLWVADDPESGESCHGAGWSMLWRAVRAIDARLVVVDPVSAAMADVSTSETGPVRAFLRALSREAAPNKADGWGGCGVLLVAHDTKSARDAIRRGEEPGAGVVAGSAAWYDGSRGVFSLMRDPKAGSDDRLLECVKANYGSTGWGARLGERRQFDGAFRGLELIAPLSREEIAAAKKKPKTNRATGAASEEENPFE